MPGYPRRKERKKKKQDGGHETGRVVYTYKKLKRNKVLEYVRCHFVNAACDDDTARREMGGKEGKRDQECSTRSSGV